ncbi:hypothetical protein ACQKQA_01055 [Pseudomonas sp. NPDC089530]|uniref:hypothetical protein n=1 Tax=Pseudomonas sp. NPDC089530 TaxID=3390651 RepID=UPI003D0839D8
MSGRFCSLLLGMLLGSFSCQGTPPAAIVPPPETALRAKAEAIAPLPATAPVRKAASRPRDGLGSSYARSGDPSHTLLSF